MKRLLILLLIASPPIFAQVSGTITSSQTVCIGVSAEHSTVGVQVTGTWTGTLQPQVAIQGQALTNSQVVPSTSTTPAATITGNGVYYANVGSASQFCILGNTVASGTAVIFLNASKGVNASTLGGGGGAGTVTSIATTGPITGGTITGTGTIACATCTTNAAALTSNGVVLGGGGQAAAVSTVASDNGTTFTYTGTGGVSATGTTGLSAGANSGAAGVLNLAGSTSGTATFTAPAAAGTLNNPVVSSNAIQVPNGYRFNTDTSISRLGASLVSVGNGTIGDESAGFRSGNACRVTGDITLTVNTAITVCSFALPAVAKAWAWQCKIPWVISAGSGTNTISIGVNASQTPTGTTNASAEIKTTNANAATEATVALSASGAVNVLTSGTITPAATVFQSSTFGTILASATAGTFVITMTAAGTTATALAKAGATCYLY